jgi:hypothetical protein
MEAREPGKNCQVAPVLFHWPCPSVETTMAAFCRKPLRGSLEASPCRGNVYQISMDSEALGTLFLERSAPFCGKSAQVTCYQQLTTNMVFFKVRSIKVN